MPDEPNRTEPNRTETRPALTIVTYPLQIATSAAGPGVGAIGVTLCPGKHQTALSGAKARDLAEDLDRIAAAVVSLVTARDLDPLIR